MAKRKENNVTFTMTMENGDYDKFKKEFPHNLVEEMQSRRMMATVKEILKTDGKDFIEKADNLIKDWDNVEEQELCTNPNVKNDNNNRYKLKYK